MSRVAPPQGLGDALAQKVAEAVWPWVGLQRWCPGDGNGETPPKAVALWDLDSGTVGDHHIDPLSARSGRTSGARAWILALRVGTVGPLLQVPLVAWATQVVKKEPGRTEDTNADPEPNPRIDAKDVIGRADGWALADGALSPTFWQAWSRHAHIVSGSRRALERASAEVTALGMEQSNTSVILDGGSESQDHPALENGPELESGTGSESGSGRLIAKVFRVLHPGVNPEAELPAALTEIGWEGVPRLRATWDLPPLRDDVPGEVHISSPNADSLNSMCSAVVSEAIENATDGFDLFVELAHRGEDPRADAAALGSTVAQMHHSLLRALGADSPQSGSALADAARLSVSRMPPIVGADPAEDEALASALLSQVEALFEALPDRVATQRIHGDLHLGQTLRTPEGDWYVLDFEGEPLKPISQRAAPGTTAQDVAGMLRSFDYAWKRGHGGPDDEAWTTRARHAFLQGYEEAAEGALPSTTALRTLLEIDKAAYELRYETQFRPDYADVPASALKLLAQGAPDRPGSGFDVRDFEHE